MTDWSENQAACSALRRQLAWARRGRSALDSLMGRGAAMQVWQHYPRHDVLEPQGRWQFYFHAHADTRVGREHGHIHLFRRMPQGELAHFVALSLDPCGVPLAWFTTNRWVTGGRWLRAASLLRDAQFLALQVRGPLSGVALWLADLVRLYREPLRGLMLARDQALAAHAATRGISHARALEDRDLDVLSRHPMDWPRDALALVAPARAFF